MWQWANKHPAFSGFVLVAAVMALELLSPISHPALWAFSTLWAVIALVGLAGLLRWGYAALRGDDPDGN